MGILRKLLGERQQVRNSASFSASNLGRLTASWTQDPGAINRLLRYGLRTMRARSRDLARGDAYGAKFVRSCVDNIGGPQPFKLQAKVKKKSGAFNDAANSTIETTWRDWTRVGACEITGKLSLYELDRLTIACLARDGEVLLRKLRGPQFDGFKMQIVDIDRLDEQKNDNLGAAGAIKMGVQVDLFGRPTAYHILKQHPGELGDWGRGDAREYEVVPADQILHLFVPDFPEQVRGFPWMHASMLRLWHLGGFEEAAVINARIGASKIAALETPADDGKALANLATGQDARGNFEHQIVPGEFLALPQGTKISGNWNPQFPDASVEPFIRACLRGAAAGVNMAYHSLANDPAEVNYSTAQVFRQDEHDHWYALQQWYIDHCAEPRTWEWFQLAVLTGKLPSNYLTYRDMIEYQGRRWRPVDPLKEASANVLNLDAQLTSRTRINAEKGEDQEDIFDEIAAENAAAKEKGIVLASPLAPKTLPASDQPHDGNSNAGDGGNQDGGNGNADSGNGNKTLAQVVRLAELNR